MADGRTGLFDLLKAHVKEARVGGLLGFIGSGSFLFTNGGSWTNFVGEWIVRLIFTCLIAVCSAICTAWAKDVYSNFKEYRKKKEDEHKQRKRERDQKGRAA